MPQRFLKQSRDRAAIRTLPNELLFQRLIDALCGCSARSPQYEENTHQGCRGCENCARDQCRTNYHK